MSVNWIAAVATLIAAFTIAANLGARVTGWGFVGYVLASALWITSQTTATDPDSSVVFMHSVLLLVNLFGAWRWLAVKKRHEEGRERAAEHSRRARVPTLFSAESLIGSAVRGDAMTTRATVVDAMLRCDQRDLGYVVTTEGGVGGAGATLRAVPPEHLRFDEDDVKCDLTEAQWQSLPAIEDDRWPKTAPPAQR